MSRRVKYGSVVLADSHLNMVTGVYSLLETVFDSVLMVSDQHSLLEAVSAFQPDLVVADLSLARPGECAGDNLASRLTRHSPELRLIVLSVYDDPIVVDKIRSAGALGFVLKRSVGSDLLPAVREVLAGRTYVSPAVCGTNSLEGSTDDVTQNG
jgi:DNA-binding NarL/FixJ family response regulator